MQIKKISRNNRGNALDDLGRFEEAIASYDKVLKLNSDKYCYYWKRVKDRQNLLEFLQRDWFFPVNWETYQHQLLG